MASKMLLPLVMTLALAGGAGSPERLRVVSSPEAAPCVRAAVAALPPGLAVEHETAAPLSGPVPADVVVASAVEVTRLLEGGDAELHSDADLGEVRWALRGPGLAALARGLADLEAAGLTVHLLPGPAMHAARRALEGLAPGRTREARSLEQLERAPLALVPSSWLASGEPAARPDQLPTLAVRAAVSARTARPEAARALLRALLAERPRRAFAAACSGAGT